MNNNIKKTLQASEQAQEILADALKTIPQSNELFDKTVKTLSEHKETMQALEELIPEEQRQDLQRSFEAEIKDIQDELTGHKSHSHLSHKNKDHLDI